MQSYPFRSQVPFCCSRQGYGSDGDKGNLFYLSAIPFAILMILLSLFICHSNLRDVNIFLLSGIIIYHRYHFIDLCNPSPKKQWYGTEE